jgi:hypothetical protein
MEFRQIEIWILNMFFAIISFIGAYYMNKTIQHITHKTMYKRKHMHTTMQLPLPKSSGHTPIAATRAWGLLITPCHVEASTPPARKCRMCEVMGVCNTIT